MITTLSVFFLVACGSPAAEPTADPAAQPAAEPAPAATTVLASGTIQVPDGAPVAQAVYVSLRKAGVRGPPLAAKRLPAGPFPLAFELTEADRPMTNGAVPDTFELKVTLDVDGDPMSKSDMDLEIVQETKKGSTALALTLGPRG